MPENLFDTFEVGALKLRNRIVMAPMTRGRAENPGLVPNALMAEYYGQRAGAGLIVTEGTWINREGIGFIHVPGIFSSDQVEGWRLVTRAVHEKGGKIFLQLGHAGAMAHPDLLSGERPWGPSEVNQEDQAFTPAGFQPTATPRAMTISDIARSVEDYKRAAENAKDAGFDGVEVHGAHVYFIPAFLSTITNKRTDLYGGSAENRSRFLFEILEAVIGVWGPKKVGLKLSPASKSGIMAPNADSENTFVHVAQKLNDYPLAYLHSLEAQTPLEGGAEIVFRNVAGFFRRYYRGTLVAGGGFSKETGEVAIQSGAADLIAYGTPFIANPDLPARFARGIPLAAPDRNTFYSGGPKGYVDYPAAT